MRIPPPYGISASPGSTLNSVRLTGASSFHGSRMRSAAFAAGRGQIAAYIRISSNTPGNAAPQRRISGSRRMRKGSRSIAASSARRSYTCRIAAGSSSRERNSTPFTRALSRMPSRRSSSSAIARSLRFASRRRKRHAATGKYSSAAAIPPQTSQRSRAFQPNRLSITAAARKYAAHTVVPRRNAATPCFRAR